MLNISLFKFFKDPSLDDEFPQFDYSKKRPTKSPASRKDDSKSKKPTRGKQDAKNKIPARKNGEIDEADELFSEPADTNENVNGLNLNDRRNKKTPKPRKNQDNNDDDSTDYDPYYDTDNSQSNFLLKNNIHIII